MNGQFSHFKLISPSQKRKSEDLNGDSTNGQNEDKKEDDNIEEVGCFVGNCFMSGVCLECYALI